MSPDEMRLFADISRNLGELSGTLQGTKEALQTNAQETKANTAALQEGKQTFAEIKGKLLHIEKTAPCLKGSPLPPNCTHTVVVPVPLAQSAQAAEEVTARDVAAEGARWLVTVITWAKENKGSAITGAVSVLSMITTAFLAVVAWWKSLGSPH